MNKIEQWKLSDLRESPYQETLFQDLSEEEFKELVASMDVGGLRYPIEILPSGEIIDGHMRVRAARTLKWKTIQVLVRDDLEHADESVIQAAMIEVNLLRRQLGPLEIARLYRRLREIARGQRSRRLGERDRRDLRDKLADRIGRWSGRTLDRWERLLSLPGPVQDAVSSGRLDVRRALRVVGHRNRREIAEKIAAGLPPKEVVDALAPAGNRPALSSCERYKRLVKSPQEHVDHLAGNENKVVGRVLEPADAEMLLGKAIQLFGSLRQGEARVAEEGGFWEDEHEEAT